MKPQENKEEDMDLTSIRDLNPVSVRILRIILHGLMLLSNSLDPENIKTLMKQQRHLSHDRRAKFLKEHLMNDFKVLQSLMNENAERTAGILHLIIDQFRFLHILHS